jgi:hypothetical protein
MLEIVPFNGEGRDRDKDMKGTEETKKGGEG